MPDETPPMPETDRSLIPAGLPVYIDADGKARQTDAGDTARRPGELRLELEPPALVPGPPVGEPPSWRDLPPLL